MKLDFNFRESQQAFNLNFGEVQNAGGGTGDASGKDGESAYEIAVRNGFKGTEVEWLESLQGEDGFSPSVKVFREEEFKRTVIVIEDASGVSFCTIPDGKEGKAGVSPTVEIRTEQEESVMCNRITITDHEGSKSFVVYDGTPGMDGHTPQKGKDYYTEEEKAELVAEISKTVTGDIETALDGVIAIQNELIGGDGV